MTVIADTYQAPSAVISPRYPPSTVRPACELKAPIASTKKVMVNRMNTTQQWSTQSDCRDCHICREDAPREQECSHSCGPRLRRNICNIERDQERKRDPESRIGCERRRTKGIVPLKLPHTCTRNPWVLRLWESSQHSRPRERRWLARMQQGRAARDRQPIEPAAPLWVRCS